MTKRDLKRRACSIAAVLLERWIEGESEHSRDEGASINSDRLTAACWELAAELRRRSKGKSK